MFNQCTEIPPEVEFLRKQFKDSDNKPPLPHLIELLSVFVKRFQNTYFIIDALDECEEMEDLLTTLEEFLSWNLPMLHILVFSRQLSDMETFMETTHARSHCMDVSSTRDDINLYLRQRLETDKSLSKWPEDVRQEILDILSKGAHGM